MYRNHFMNRFAYLLFIVLIISACGEDKEIVDDQPFLESPVVEVDSSMYKFGFNLNDYQVVTDSVRKNDFLSTILEKHGVLYAVVDNMARNFKDTFDIRKIRPQRPYHLLYEKNLTDSASYFIYEKSRESYVVFSLRDSLFAYNGKNPVNFRMNKASGIITSSLSMTMQEENLSPSLSIALADIYAWTIDFYRLQKGDYFQVIYEEKYIENESIGVGEIISANFNHGGEDFYCYLFASDSIPNYFDEKGQSLKKTFLKSPLRYSRISSRYSKRRFHPVLKRFKSHLGTDYAAPSGTPILAVGDGTVIKSEYKRNNGNYVKIHHNSTYETQYLHMSKRLVKVGDVLRQGQTIGLVGSTGLATGPHVCFRFWKNGKQENHLREKFPPATPVDSLKMDAFNLLVDSTSREINKIPLKQATLIPDEGN